MIRRGNRGVWSLWLLLLTVLLAVAGLVSTGASSLAAVSGLTAPNAATTATVAGMTVPTNLSPRAMSRGPDRQPALVRADVRSQRFESSASIGVAAEDGSVFWSGIKGR
jgi:hypothetical protein